jgi:hypothetical protein
MTVAGRFVKKPVEVEAVQWEQADQAAVIVAWCEGKAEFCPAGSGHHAPVIVLDTLHGPTNVVLGEWIIRGEGGDYWPNTAAEFTRNYEAA